ncbi:MAG: hypothetical protein ACM3ZC_14720 [Bacteroidota bacterium]
MLWHIALAGYTSKNGMNINGVIPDDQRRNGSFSNPPVCNTDYHWGQQGWIMAGRILNRMGMSIYQVDNQAIFRCTNILQNIWATQFGA